MQKGRYGRLGRICVILMALGLAYGAGWLWSRPAGTAVGCRQEDLADVTDQSFLNRSAQMAADADPAADADAEQPKYVCLTFDDGPSKTTAQILDTLAQEQVPATFFVICADNNRDYLPLVQRELQEGHQIALHSACHDYKAIYANADAYWADIENLKEQLSLYMDVSQIDCLRFPGGSTNTVSRKYGGKGLMQRLKTEAEEKAYHWIDWNVCADDAIGGHPSARTIYENVVEDVEDKDTCVVLMHDTAATKNTAKALPDIIAWFRSHGYRFCTVDEMLMLRQDVKQKEDAQNV